MTTERPKYPDMRFWQPWQFPEVKKPVKTSAWQGQPVEGQVAAQPSYGWAGMPVAPPSVVPPPRPIPTPSPSWQDSFRRFIADNRRYETMVKGRPLTQDEENVLLVRAERAYEKSLPSPQPVQPVPEAKSEMEKLIAQTQTLYPKTLEEAIYPITAPVEFVGRLAAASLTSPFRPQTAAEKIRTYDPIEAVGKFLEGYDEWKGPVWGKIRGYELRPTKGLLEMVANPIYWIPIPGIQVAAGTGTIAKATARFWKEAAALRLKEEAGQVLSQTDKTILSKARLIDAQVTRSLIPSVLREALAGERGGIGKVPKKVSKPEPFKLPEEAIPEKVAKPLPLFKEGVTKRIIAEGRQADLAIRLGWLDNEGQLTELGRLMLDEPLSNLSPNIRPLATELREAVKRIPKLAPPKAKPVVAEVAPVTPEVTEVFFGKNIPLATRTKVESWLQQIPQQIRDRLDIVQIEINPLLVTKVNPKFNAAYFPASRRIVFKDISALENKEHFFHELGHSIFKTLSVEEKISFRQVSSKVPKLLVGSIYKPVRRGRPNLQETFADAFAYKSVLGKELEKEAPEVTSFFERYFPSEIAIPGKVTPVPEVKPVISPPEPPTAIVPSKPVIKPDGKLWLPEPPRVPGEFMPFVRKEMTSKFRGKVGIFDVVEQANQMVLKARDIGKNTVPYVMSYIRQIGNVTKEFALDAKGTVTNIGNPEGRSLAINDVLSNYTHYTLTPKQLELAKRHGSVYREALKLAKSYGVKIEALGNPDEFWQYIARRVKGKLNPLTGEYEIPPGVVGGFRMGAKISAQKERLFDEMAQGVDLGFLYENPDQVLAHHIQGIYRLIGNKQAQNLVEPLTRAITKEAPLRFGERAVAEPALKNRAAAVEIANAIDKIYAYQGVPKGLEIAREASGAMVGQVAALDVSAPFIQGLPILGHDLKMGLSGRFSAVWARSYGNMWKSVVNPERINAFRAEHSELYKRAIEYGVATGDSEFVSGVSVAQKALGKVPVAGKTIKSIYRQVWGRMGQAYSDFLEIARIRMFEQLEPVWAKSGEDLFALGAVVNRMTGTISATARGVSPTRQAAERIAAFAPNYLRASLLLMRDMVGRGATAREVQASIAALLGIGATVYYAEEKIRGQEPKMKPWAKRLGGDGADAYTTLIGDTRVGLGSWMYGMIKTLADVTAIAIDDPSALLVWDQQHPIVRFAKTKAGPGVSLASELATGRNFYGQKFDSPSDYIMRLVESLAPIASQSMITQEPKGGIVQVAAEAMGARAYPYSPEGVLRKRSTAGLNVFGESRKRTHPFWQVVSPEQASLAESELDRLEVNIGFVSGEISDVDLSKDEKQEYQILSGQAVKVELAKLVISPKYLSLTKGEQAEELQRTARKAKDEARDVYIMQSDFSVPHSEDDKETKLMRGDLQKVSGWLKVVSDMKSDDAKNVLRTMISSLDPDLDVALNMTGYSSGTKSDMAEKMRIKRINGEPATSGIVIPDRTVTAFKQAIESYYGIEDKVWGMYLPSVKEFADKIAPLDEAKEKAELRKSPLGPSVLRAREMIAYEKLKMRATNRLVDIALDSYYGR